MGDSILKTLIYGGLVLMLSPSLALSGTALPTDPSVDRHFLQMSNGFDLTNLQVRNQPLSLIMGTNEFWGNSEVEAYEVLKTYTLSEENQDLQWVLKDLSSGRVEAESCHSQLKFFGASVSKLFVAAAYLDFKGGVATESDLQLLSDLIVVSDNQAWLKLQNDLLGEGNPDLGRQRVHQFTQKMGYRRTRGFQGWWGEIHGNELTSFETSKFLADTYNDRYQGAEWIWKILFTSRTGTWRGKRFLPEDLFIGGKTGTYSGTTVDPETGEDTFPDGSPYRVQVRHHVMVMNIGGRVYSLVLFNNRGDQEMTALLARGLIEDFRMGLLQSCHL